MVQYMYRTALPSPENAKYRNDIPGGTSQKVVSHLPATTWAFGELSFQPTAMGLKQLELGSSSIHKSGQPWLKN